MLQSSPAERELGVLANSKGNMKGQGEGLVAAQLFTEAPAESPAVARCSQDRLCLEQNVPTAQYACPR